MASYFFDSSALVKLYHPEIGSAKVEAIFREPGRQIIISRLAVVEIHSALAGKIRMGTLSPATAKILRSRGEFIREVGGNIFAARG